MSAVTATIVIGSRHRSDPGIQPRWIAMLHEGRNYAWHLLRLQLTGADVGGTGLDDPPGVLWRASQKQDVTGELALMLHLYATRTPEIIEAARHCYSLKRRRVDLAEMTGKERGDFENAVRLAHENGRELLLAATILPGSRLTHEALLELPGWEMTVSYPALTREWSPLDGGGLIVTDLREGAEPPDRTVEPDDLVDDEPGAWDSLLGADRGHPLEHDDPQATGDGDAPDDAPGNDAPDAADEGRHGPVRPKRGLSELFGWAR